MSLLQLITFIARWLEDCDGSSVPSWVKNLLDHDDFASVLFALPMNIVIEVARYTVYSHLSSDDFYQLLSDVVDDRDDEGEDS